MTIRYAFDAATRVAHAHMDDGKANTLKDAWCDAVDEVLARSLADEAAALVWWGRETFFSAGIDLKAAMGLPDDDARLASLVRIAETTLAIWTHPMPTVAAITGHAIAGGCVLALACDHRIAVTGTYRIGLNETAIGMVLPTWALVIAQATLPPEQTNRLLLRAELVAPGHAEKYGIVHEVVTAGDLDDAVGRITRDYAALPTKPYGALKRRLRSLDAERGASLAAREMRVVPPAGGGA